MNNGANNEVNNNLLNQGTITPPIPGEQPVLGIVGQESQEPVIQPIPVQNGQPREEIKAAKVYKYNAPTEQQQQEPAQQVPIQPVVNQEPNKEKPKKKKNALARFFFLIILIMAAVIGYLFYSYKNTLLKLNEVCTPVTTNSNSKKLNLNSTIVQDLYSKIKTNIREDLAENDLNDTMKLYLAYKQIPKSKFYASNCNLFDISSMIPYTCSESTNFIPLAFKEESLIVEYKKLFGENQKVPLENIQIGKNCIVGYQYIKARGEYVQGQCNENVTTTYKVKKELIEATSNESTIIIKERVKYSSSEGMSLPEHLRNGIYRYTFKLDTNYNYVLVKKELEQE